MGWVAEWVHRVGFLGSGAPSGSLAVRWTNEWVKKGSFFLIFSFVFCLIHELERILRLAWSSDAFSVEKRDQLLCFFTKPEEADKNFMPLNFNFFPMSCLCDRCKPSPLSTFNWSVLNYLANPQETDLFWLFMTCSLHVFNKLRRIINSLISKLYEEKVWWFLLISSSFSIQSSAK